MKFYFILVGFGYRDGNGFFLLGWVWDKKTHICPNLLPSLIGNVLAPYSTLPNNVPLIKYSKKYVIFQNT